MIKIHKYINQAQVYITLLLIMFNIQVSIFINIRVVNFRLYLFNKHTPILFYYVILFVFKKLKF